MTLSHFLKGILFIFVNTQTKLDRICYTNRIGVIMGDYGSICRNPLENVGS